MFGLIGIAIVLGAVDEHKEITKTVAGDECETLDILDTITPVCEHNVNLRCPYYRQGHNCTTCEFNALSGNFDIIDFYKKNTHD